MAQVIESTKTIMQAATQDRQQSRAELMIAWNAQKESWIRERALIEAQNTQLKSQLEALEGRHRDQLLQNAKLEKAICDIQDQINESVTWIDDEK